MALIGIRFEHLTYAQAAILFAVPAVFFIGLSLRSMAGLGPVRRFVALGLRLALLATLVLILAGLKVERRAKDVEVIVVKDISLSTARVSGYPGGTLGSSIDKFVADVAKTKQPGDRIGIVSFAQQALIEAMPSKVLGSSASAVRDVAGGTDIGAAIQLSLATFGDGAMRRLVLITDGNNTTGDLDSALALARSQQIPIDVVPLYYDAKGEVLLDRLTTPTWRRENEPFTMDIVLRSTNATPSTGKLTVLHQGIPMAIGEKGELFRRVGLQPGLNIERVRVPALHAAGTHEFRALFEPDDAASGNGISIQQPGTPGSTPGGTGASAATTQPSKAMSTALLANRSGSSFTFVRGKGQILYVDNVPGGGGVILRDALARQGISITDENVIDPTRFPTSLIQLTNYDAIILANVPRGMGGLSEEQESNLAQYVHELGGGLVVIGGPEAFGAGGWSGSKLEKILPVDMEVPSQRQIPKGALVLNMHSCEMPDGNYWGEQCAIKATEALSARDEIGILSFDWGGRGSQWDFPLQAKGDGGKAVAAIKQMRLGDMPSFDDSFNVALHGRDGNPGLKDSDAKQKHMICISDGDPAPPAESLIQEYIDAKVTVSTVSVYPHDGSDAGLPHTMRIIAERLHGRAYGPINDNPQQLPQIFIKEASVVKRSLIQEDGKGFQLSQAPALTDAIKGISVPGTITGYVLTARKNSPQVEVPIVVGAQHDPVLAYWQTGLGRSIVFTSDAYNRWAASWYASPVFDRFWSQVVRAVAKPPMNAELDIQTSQEGDKGKIVVEATKTENQGGGFQSFLNIHGQVIAPDGTTKEVRLLQTAPGVYEAQFDAPQQGNYVVSMAYSSPDGKGGMLLSGLARTSSRELRDLHSNDTELNEIATRTAGRLLTPWDVATNTWFTRDGLAPKVSPLPVWQSLIPLALLLLILDVAIRRIALDKPMVLAALNAVRGYLRGFTATTREDVDKEHARKMAALREREAALQAAQGTLSPDLSPQLGPTAAPLPKVEGDLTDLVGGASATDTSTRRETGKPKPDAPKGDAISGLMAAKKKAQQKIDEKRNEET